MSDPEAAAVVEGEEDNTPGYKAPAQKSLQEIINADQEDESLRKYKEALLGGADTAGLEVFPNDPRKVVVTKLSLVIQDRPERALDLTCSDLSQLKKQTFIIKEGCHYRIRISFFVQREIVPGLKYVQKSHRKGIQVDKSVYMVGSYGPKKEEQFYLTPDEEAPSGLLSRGTYTIKSLFTDDDKHEHLKWEWTLEIKKDWE